MDDNRYGKIEGPNQIKSPKFWQNITLINLIYAILGLIIGAVFAAGGIILFFHGIAAPASSWTASFIGATSSMSDAPPGVVLFVCGLFIIFITRLNVKIK